MTVKQSIDIEALLSWAYREQCVDRMCAGFSPKGPSASPANNLANYLTLGTRVDSSNFASRIIDSGNVADDALAVHAAVLALDDVFIEWETDSRLKLWTHETAVDEGFSICERNGGSGRTYWKHNREMKAECRLDFIGASILMITHAKAGDRPEWHEGWRPVKGRKPLRRGKMKDRWGRTLKSRMVDDYSVSRDRGIYRVWWWALELLAAQLSDDLERFNVTGPVTVAEPWMSDSPVKTSKILQNRFGNNSLNLLTKNIT